MATSALLGDARIEYTPPSEALVTHLLAVPLIELEGGQIDLWGTIRCENQPTNLIDLLENGLMDVTLTYRLTDSGTAYPVKLVEVVGAILDPSYHAWWSKDGLTRHVVKVGTAPVARKLLSPDRDRLGFGEYEARLHLRRTDGDDLEDLL